MNKCKTCKYWHQRERGAAYGECRRFPPTAGTDWVLDDRHPMTRADCWCGEFAIKTPVTPMTPMTRVDELSMRESSKRWLRMAGVKIVVDLESASWESMWKLAYFARYSERNLFIDLHRLGLRMQGETRYDWAK